MVVVELRAPVYDEEAGEIVWRSRAIVRAHRDGLQVMGEEMLLGDETMTVIDLASGRRLSRADDPEGFTRNLPYAYRSGDLVAVVVIDSDSREPPPAGEDPRTLPVLSAPRSQSVQGSSAANA